jgi:hypothetical protein
LNHPVSSLLAIVLSLATSAPALAQATPPYKRTILVGGATTPRANGTNLLDALAKTGGTGPNNRWLLRLEPGIYNLDSSALIVKSFVDIEGSGRGMTTITSKADVTLLWPPEVTAEVRDLTVQNFAGSGSSEGVLLASSNARLSRVNVLARGTQSATAVRIFHPDAVISPVLTDVQVTAFAGSVNHFATGLFIVGANPVVRNLSVNINGSHNIFGVSSAFGGAPLLEDVDISVGGNCQSCTGIDVLKSSVKLTRGRIVVTGHFASAVGHVQGGTVEISHSFLIATGSSTTGIGIQEVGGGALVVEHSTVEGHAENNQGRSIYSAGATVRVAMSRLVGPILNGLTPGDPQSTFTCLGAYNASFAPLNAKCE